MRSGASSTAKFFLLEHGRFYWFNGMPSGEKVEEVLSEAVALEKKYDWLGARDLYEQALEAADEKDFLKKGELQERIGYCLHRAAFQAETREEFRQRLGLAVEAYEKSCGFYERLREKEAWVSRCRAVVRFLQYWLTADLSEKVRLLDECLEFEGRALEVFLDSGNMLEYGRTYNGLSLVFWHRAWREFYRPLQEASLSRLLQIANEGIQWGEKAVAELSKLGDSHEMAVAHFTLATCLNFLINRTEEPEKQEQLISRCSEHLNRAIQLSEKVGDDYQVGLSCLRLPSSGREQGIAYSEKAVECGEKTGDIFLKGGGLESLASSVAWKIIGTEDPDERKRLGEEAVQYYDKAEHLGSIISFYGLGGGAMARPVGLVDYYYWMALFEAEPEKKLEFLERAVQLGRKALKVAEESGCNIASAHFFFAIALSGRGRIEPDIDRKRNLLEEAVKYDQSYVERYEQLAPFDYANLSLLVLGGIKSELGNIEADAASKTRMLEEAMLDFEKGLEGYEKIMPSYERIGRFHSYAPLHLSQDRYATLLTNLYDLTNRSEHLRRAVEILQKAIYSASKVNLNSRVAEYHWKIAKIYAVLEEHLEAAENFENASQGYTKAAEKIPQLKEFYRDHSSYLQAWSEIEKAKQCHAEKEYGTAKEYYEKAADLHKSTQRWNHLSSNYQAWARLEEAEDQSRREQTEEAKGLFQQAANLFTEAEKSIKAVLGKIENKDEKENAADLIKASSTRREYCLGRIALEEAKILDRKGNHVASSREYGSAARIFQTVFDAMKDESDRQELKPIICLCQAWRAMTRAEAELSPELYLEASELFDEAKEHSLDEHTKTLALGNSSFCKALEAGTRYEATRDTTMYSTAKKYIEAAETYYLRAGFTNASEYAKATYTLLDAYMYTHQAETETDPKKKAQYYQVAERLLQASAGSYIKARHPEKNDQIQRLLENIKEKRQLTLSLSEILHAPITASTTMSFSTPTQTHEQTVGLERFEQADIQANLILREKEAKVGEDLDLEIELVNAGKAPALLIKISDLLPEGFEIKTIPETYRYEDTYINLKGKRLDPLKTEELKIVIKPLSKGTFTMKPRILYLDEQGKYKSHEPEPAIITVKELGISGWLKGPRS